MNWRHQHQTLFECDWFRVRGICFKFEWNTLRSHFLSLDDEFFFSFLFLFGWSDEQHHTWKSTIRWYLIGSDSRFSCVKTYGQINYIFHANAWLRFHVHCHKLSIWPVCWPIVNQKINSCKHITCGPHTGPSTIHTKFTSNSYIPIIHMKSTKTISYIEWHTTTFYRFQHFTAQFWRKKKSSDTHGTGEWAHELLYTRLYRC